MVKKLFVYGTLMKEQMNHGYLEGYLEMKQAYVEDVQHSGGARAFPMIELGEGIQYGELYFFQDEHFNNIILPNVDRLEGHPKFYERVDWEVYEVSGDIKHNALVYMKPVTK
jgi:gamma-glutamylcyclotransferase (GGCT)/AIG2-like uncharacterized protein YtfP